MRLRYALASLLAMGLGATGSALAVEHTGLYLSAFGGYTMPDTDADFTDLSTDLGPLPDVSFGLDDGASAVVAIGYDFGRFRLEGEASYRWNDLEDVTSGAFTSTAISGDFQAASLMVNALVDIPITDRFEFYVGAGAGVAAIWMDPTFTGGPFGSVDYDLATWAVAYQGMAGVTWHLNDRWALMAGYRIWSTLDADLGDSWDDDELDGDLEMPLIHTVEIGLRYSF